MDVKEKNTQAKAAISTRVNQLSTLVESAGNGDDLQIYAVPISYAVGVRQADGSTLTTQEYEDLLESLKLTQLKMD